MKRPDRGSRAWRALEELEFGEARTLDLRASLPSAREAERRVEAWLRARQVLGAGEVLVITGRGRGSNDGVAVVRPAVEQRLARLRRQGVVSAIRPRGPGAFAVTLAPVGAVLSAAARSKDPRPPRTSASVLVGLSSDTMHALRALALHALEQLGAPRSDALIADEMARQFSRLAAGVGSVPDREARVRDAAARALAELRDA